MQTLVCRGRGHPGGYASIFTSLSEEWRPLFTQPSAKRAAGLTPEQFEYPILDRATCGPPDKMKEPPEDQEFNRGTFLEISLISETRDWQRTEDKHTHIVAQALHRIASHPAVQHASAHDT